MNLEACWSYIQTIRKQRVRDIIRRRVGVMPAPDFPLGLLGCESLIRLHPEPERVFSMPPARAEEYFAGDWRRDLGNIRFLRHERLRQDLYSAMLEFLGYRPETLDDALELTPARLNEADAQQKARALRELEQKPWLGEEILRDERVYTERFLLLAGAPSGD